MSSIEPQDTVCANKMVERLTALQAHLKTLRITINDEIGSYPAPIPACDAQFNYLLGQRDKLSKVMRLVDACVASLSAGRPAIRNLEEIASQLGQIDTEWADRFRAAIEAT